MFTRVKREIFARRNFAPSPIEPTSECGDDVERQTPFILEKREFKQEYLLQIRNAAVLLIHC